MIRGERFLKKYKIPIAILAILIIIAIIASFTMSYVQKNNLEIANQAYSELNVNPSDKQALQTLKSKNLSLYYLYKFQTAVNSGDTKMLQTLSEAKDINPILKQIVNFELNKPSGDILSSYSDLINGFEFLKKNEISKANIEFAKIPISSVLFKIAEQLKHYHGKTK